MNDKDSVSKAAWQLEFEREFAEWEQQQKTPPPTPKPPPLEPALEVMAQMRDGVSLFTRIYLRPGEERPQPVVLVRTPYPDPIMPVAFGPIGFFLEAGYAVVVQWCRGTWKSEGSFRFFQNEAEDGYDTIEWIAEQSWSNGRIGMYGSSYSASVQWLAARLQPPHLTCIAPQSPGAMFFYETPFLGGVPFKIHLLSWPKLVGSDSMDDIDIDDEFDRLAEDHPIIKAFRQTPNSAALEAYLGPEMAAALREPLEHPTFDDWWEEIMLTEKSAKVIDLPILAITGFHDGDQAGCLYSWEQVEAANSAGSAQRHLLIGPWRHAQMLTGVAEQMGEVSFGDNASVSLPEQIRNFFDIHLKGEGEPALLPGRCRLYTSGSNLWRDDPAYPPSRATEVPVFLASNGGANSIFGDGELSFNAASGRADKFPANWQFPVPAVGIGEDSRSNLVRHDVLVYTGESLENDLTVLGPVTAVLHMAVDALDADVILRIEDVFPDGRSVNMTGELGCAAFRARYRDGFDREQHMVPGEAAELRFHVCHMGHTFLRGHRIRVVICSSADRLLEPNHHTGEPVLTATDRRAAIQTILHDTERPSRLLLPVVPS